MVSYWHVTSIGHIHGEKYLCFIQPVPLHKMAKAYNQFVSIDTSEHIKLTVILFVAQVNTTLDESKTFDFYY